MLDIEDTIVAVASAPGRAALGIVRLSGPQALPLATTLFRSTSFHRSETGSTCAAGELVLDPGLARDPARGAGLSVPAQVYVFRGPRSFTGQDCVEVHTVGSPVLLGMVVARLVARGARQAGPGEFTTRAFLSGRIDLSQAEAVAQVIRARSDGQLRAARRLLEGHLSERLAAAREALTDLTALVEADIDFAEEPIEFISPAELGARIAAIEGDLIALLNDARACQRLDSVPRVLLLGRPNAGKSSLLNALSGVDRAICSAVAGTTRDVLSVPVQLARGEAILLDAAGIDDATDALLVQGRQRVQNLVGTVDLVCLVLDASLGVAAAESVRGALLPAGPAADAARVVVAANKADLLSAVEIAEQAAQITAWGIGPVCHISAKTGACLDLFKDRIAAALHDDARQISAASVYLTARQMEALEAAVGALRWAAAHCAGIRETAQRAELIAFDLREALDALGSVSGPVTTEDLLTRIFSSFCIGK